jgi:hypothetical protein
MPQLQFFVFSILILFVVLYFSKEVRNEGFLVEEVKQEISEEKEVAIPAEGFYAPQITEDELEGFWTSPGVMDQLESTRVASKKEQEMENTLYDNLTAQGIINMTETGYKGSDFASTAME